MISYQDALQLISATCRPLEATPTPLDALIGMAPVDDVHSNMNVPSFANSAMDGFALRAADTALAGTDTPVEISVTDESSVRCRSADVGEQDFLILVVQAPEVARRGVLDNPVAAPVAIEIGQAQETFGRSKPHGFDEGVG